MAIFLKQRPMPDVGGNTNLPLEMMSVDDLLSLKMRIEKLLAPRAQQEVEALTAKLSSLKNSFGIGGDDGDAVKKKRRKRRKSTAGDLENDAAEAPSE